LKKKGEIRRWGEEKGMMLKRKSRRKRTKYHCNAEKRKEIC
jgi:hypothetical protein